MAFTVRTLTSAWIILGIAILFETGGAVGLHFSKGFTVLVPTVVSLLSFGIAVFLVGRIVMIIPVSVAYPVWAGGGTAGVALFGILVLDEAADTLKLIGIVLIFVGIILMNRITEETS